MSVTSCSAVVSPHHSDVVNALILEVETLSMALVGPLSAGPPAANVSFDFDMLSMPVTVTSDNVKIGPFTPSADLNIYLKSQFPDTETVEDVITMSPVMSTLIPTVKVFDGVRPTWRKWSKGLATYAMINELYDHYTGHAVEPDQPQKPAEPVKPEQPQPTTRLEGEATITVPVPATTMRAHEQ
ncbi:hypothetical protein PQX77_011445 [Marasmius sp. AFHP31]|nr:hypothetical protein PQX77_011445 [Marasmius sp. AFHP31]